MIRRRGKGRKTRKKSFQLRILRQHVWFQSRIKRSNHRDLLGKRIYAGYIGKSTMAHKKMLGITKTRPNQRHPHLTICLWQLLGELSYHDVQKRIIPGGNFHLPAMHIDRWMKRSRKQYSKIKPTLSLITLS